MEVVGAENMRLDRADGERDEHESRFSAILIQKRVALVVSARQDQIQRDRDQYECPVVDLPDQAHQRQVEQLSPAFCPSTSLPTGRSAGKDKDKRWGQLLHFAADGLDRADPLRDILLIPITLYLIFVGRKRLTHAFLISIALNRDRVHPVRHRRDPGAYFQAPTTSILCCRRATAQED